MMVRSSGTTRQVSIGSSLFRRNRRLFFHSPSKAVLYVLRTYCTVPLVFATLRSALVGTNEQRREETFFSKQSDGAAADNIELGQAGQVYVWYLERHRDKFMGVVIRKHFRFGNMMVTTTKKKSIRSCI